MDKKKGLCSYVSQAFYDWLNQPQNNLEKCREPILLGTDDEESHQIKISNIQRRLSNIEDRFTSAICTNAIVDEINGLFKIKFSIVYPLNCSDKKLLMRSVENDIIKSYSNLFDALEITYGNLEQFILVELRAQKLLIAVAMNNTGLKKIQMRKQFIEKNFDKIVKL